MTELKGIDDNTAPGGDGFDAYFFKQAWSTIGDEVIEAILSFFQENDLYTPVTKALVTLIPKVQLLSSIKEYRSISCCTIIYKII